VKVWQKIIILSVLPYFFIGCHDRCELWKELTEKYNKKIYLNGKVASIDTAQDRVRSLIIKMEDGTQYHPYFQGLLEIVEVGDSLIKDSGSFKHIVIHPSIHITDTVYPCCDRQRLFEKNH
jgi:hypothetical protein